MSIEILARVSGPAGSIDLLPIGRWPEGPPREAGDKWSGVDGRREPPAEVLREVTEKALDTYKEVHGETRIREAKVAIKLSRVKRGRGR